MLTEIGLFLVDATEGERGQSEPGSNGETDSKHTCVVDAQLERFWRSYGALRGRNDEALTVAVLALTKSGEGR